MSELELWNELGNIYYRTGAYDEAIRTFQKVIELNPGCFQPYGNLASIFVSQGRYADAIPMYQKGIELTDASINQAFLWDQLGDAFVNLEDFENACDSYKKAITLDPDNATYPKKMAEVEQISRKFLSDSMTDTNPDTLPPDKPEFKGIPSSENEGKKKALSGTACWVFEDNQPALQVEEGSSVASKPSPVILGSRLLSIETVDEDTSGNPVSSKEDTGPDQTATGIPKKVSASQIENDPSFDLDDGTSSNDPQEAFDSIEASVQSLLRLGILHWRKGEYERAIQFLKIALDRANMSQNNLLEALAYYTIAHVETDLGKIEDAIQANQSAAALAPDRIFTWNNLGDLNCRLDRYEDAQAAFQEAIEHNPKDPVSWNGLGNVYHKLGRNEDAIAAYQLGNVFENQKVVEEDVLKEFEKAIDSDQENPQFWNEAGNIYFGTGAFDNAIASYRKAIKLDSTNAAFEANLLKAERALEDANARSEPQTPEPSTGVDPQALPHSKPFVEETPSYETAETAVPESDSSRTAQAQEAGNFPGQVFSPVNQAADPEPQAAFWVFKSITPQDNAQQPARGYLPAVAEKNLAPNKPLPAFDLHTRHELAFSCNQVFTDSIQEHASRLVQLTPRAIKPTRAEEIIQFQVAKSNRQNVSVDEDSSSRISSLVEAQSNTSNSTPPAIAAGNQPGNPPDLDQQDLENNITAYRRVIEINPSNDRAWDTLGNKYESIGLHREAVEAFEQAITHCPQKEVYYYHLGIALAYQMKYNEAIQALQKVIELNPRYMLAHCALAGYYRRLGKEAEAQEHMQIAWPSMEDENEYNQACFESIGGNADRALTLLEIALQKKQIQPGLVRSDPDLDFIRNDPRFETLLVKNGIINQ